ncbi:MAG: hypothetical protein RLZZ241_1055, partial [Bacteroidota bacterium]
MVFYPPSDHISKLVRPLVRALKPYSSARDEFKSTGETFIYLDANENPNPSDVHRYPDPHQINLKNLIVSQKGLDQECLFLGNGSDEVLDLLVRAFIEPNQDKVIILPPTFGMYKVLSSLHGARLTEVPLDQNFQPDVAAILEATDSNTKLIFICSPNNPTGQTMDPDRIKILLERFPGLVVIDEAYIDFSEHPGYAKAVKNYDNLVVIQTFSKAYGLAGLRLGLCWAHPQVISYLKRIKLPYNVGELTQNRAKEVLLNPDKIAAEVAQICLERQRVAQALTQFDFIKNVFPSDANFLLFKVDDAEKRYAEMVKNGLVVRNTSGYLNLKNTL